MSFSVVVPGLSLTILLLLVGPLTRLVLWITVYVMTLREKRLKRKQRATKLDLKRRARREYVLRKLQEETMEREDTTPPRSPRKRSV